MADFTSIALDENVEEAGAGFTLIPPGSYEATIIKDKLQDNKAGTGKVWVVLLQITKGQFVNEQVKDYINVSNASAKCAAIGQGTLKRICNLTGVTYPPKDTKPMIGRPIGIKIVHEEFKSNNTGKMLKSVKVKAYIPAADVTGAAPEPPAPADAGDGNDGDDW